MKRLFGTDGIRGIFNDDLTINLIERIGASLGKELMSGNNHTLMIGMDTRESSPILKKALIKGLMNYNITVIDIGIMPTPAVVYLTKTNNIGLSVMITASHNPYQYNGIKLIGGDGYKISDELENKLENDIFNIKVNNEVHGNVIIKDYSKRYLQYLLSNIKTDLSKLSIGVDCANGCAIVTAKDLFSKIAKNVKFLHDMPNGRNVNLNCGSTNLESLQEYVYTNKLDLGIAFDGDADRVLLVDDAGEEVDGDKILAICGKYLDLDNELAKKTIVGTVMSNFGLREFCDKNDFNFVATKVGDRYVLDEMLKNGYNLGGEQSGHIIFGSLATTGDGQLTVLKMLENIEKSQNSLSSLASMMTRYPQVLNNVFVTLSGKMDFLNDEEVQRIIRFYEETLKETGRLLVRPSGTENMIRVMAEGSNERLTNEAVNGVVKVISKKYGIN